MTSIMEVKRKARIMFVVVVVKFKAKKDVTEKGATKWFQRTSLLNSINLDKCIK